MVSSSRNLASRILKLVSIVWICCLLFFSSSSLTSIMSSDFPSLKLTVLQRARSGSNSFLIKAPRREMLRVPTPISRLGSHMIPMAAQDHDDDNFESSFAREVARRRDQDSSSTTSSNSPSTKMKSDDPVNLIQNSINKRPSINRDQNEVTKSKSSSKSTSIPRAPPPPPTFRQQSAANPPPPPPFGSSSSTQNAKSSKSTFGSSRPKSEKKLSKFFDAFNFDFTDPDYGKPRAQRVSSSSEVVFSKKSSTTYGNKEIN